VLFRCLSRNAIDDGTKEHAVAGGLTLPQATTSMLITAEGFCEIARKIEQAALASHSFGDEPRS
jgi:hypothetical protein